MRPGTRCPHWPALALLTLLLARGATAAVLSVIADADLGFGQIVATSASGTVSVSPAGLRSSSGGVVLANALSVSPASFTVTGDPNLSYGIQLPESVTLSGGALSLTMDAFTSLPNGSGNLGPRGTQSVSVGATLHVAGGQPAGSYAGTYAVIIAYN